MAKKKLSFSAITEKLLLVVKRFPISILLVIGFAALMFVVIHGDVEEIVLFRFSLFFSVGAFVGVAVALCAEDFVNNLKTCAATLIAVLLWGTYCYFLPDKINSTEKIIEIIILCATAFFAMFFISFLKKNTDKSFWNFTMQTLFQMALAAVFGSILYGGLALALFALNGLFDIDIADRVYADLAVVCLVLFSMIYFLANIPNKTEKHNDEISYNKAQKILALYILTPILAVYAMILYAYLCKIIILWELPNGWVSWLVSILALGGLLVIIFLYPVRMQNENKTVAFLSRWFGVLILPLIALMSIGIFRRIGDYGITINRCYMLLLNVWFYGIYIYLFLTKSKHIKWVLISFVGIALLSSVGFWSVANVVEYSLTKEIKTILNNEKVSIKEANVLFSKLEQKDKEKIEEKLRYLNNTYGAASIQPFFSDTINHWGFYTLMSNLGLCNDEPCIEEPRAESRYFSFDKVVNDNEVWSVIDGFDTFVSVDYYSNYLNSEEVNCSVENGEFEIKIILDNRVFRLPLKKIVKDNEEEETRVIQGNDYLFLLHGCNGYYYQEQDSIDVDYFKGYLFYK